MNSIKGLMPKIEKLPTVSIFFKGQLLPHDFALPDNVLVFYHTWYPRPLPLHTRYQLVIAFSEIIYTVDQQIFPMKPGMALLIRPYQARYLEPTASHYDRLFITFELPSEQPYLPEIPLAELSPGAGKHLEAVLDAFTVGNSPVLSMELVHLFMELSKRGVPYRPRSFSSLVFRANEFISNHLTMPFGIQEIADFLNVSESNLRLVYRKETGISLGHYINNKRLEAARHHLLNTDMSLSDVARNCGYENSYTFCRFFRKHTGVPPIRFRNLSRMKKASPLTESGLEDDKSSRMDHEKDVSGMEQ